MKEPCVDLTELADRAEAAIREVETVIIGKREVIRNVLVSFLCNGHVLIEDIPGVGKTMLARTFSQVLNCSFRRIQFTPDLLPADITGTSIYNQKTQEFEFRSGPVFANVVLADEINRATPKTQSALLEAMEESQVTADGHTYALPRPFFVFATENQIELQGTYPLPEAQLDRFWMRLSIGYPSKTEEITILNLQRDHHPLRDVKVVLSLDEIHAMQRQVKEVYIAPALQEYLVEIVSATRRHPHVSLGGSPRASLCLMHSSRALAAVSGRDFVLPDDIKTLTLPVLAHRILLKPEARVRRWTTETVIREILNATPVPQVVPRPDEATRSTNPGATASNYRPQSATLHPE
ncbi:MAG: MoxR family ATPase [Armatimonadetes bacterium]|nr:MoxR family ATPase [Armatimonadota bacterium]